MTESCSHEIYGSDFCNIQQNILQEYANLFEINLIHVHLLLILEILCPNTIKTIFVANTGANSKDHLNYLDTEVAD